MSGRLLILVILLGFSLPASAWQNRPEGKFMVDSAKIGEEIFFSLSISYSKDLDIVFPDSLYDFSPFELNKKDYFFTRTDSSTSFDSAVYNLSTFEIDSIQQLALPIWIISKGDSIALFSLPDTIVLHHMVTQLPDSLALIDNSIYKEVSYKFNYPYLIIAISGLVIFVLFVIVVFGKEIGKKYKLYRMRKSHEKFLKTYQRILEGKYNRESALLEWKKYMEKLHEMPYTKLTTKEIILRTKDNFLMKALKEIDRAIYSRYYKEGSEKYFGDLVSFSKQVYGDRVRQMKYGARSN